MSLRETSHTPGIAQRLSEAEATIRALLSGEIDAVFDAASSSPVMLAEAQKALRQSEERYRQIVEATSDGIVKVDGDARVVFVNRRLAEMLGRDPAAMLGASLLDLASESARAALEDVLRRRPSGAQGAVDSTLLHQDGTDISVSIAASALFDDAGAYTGSLGVVRDVTEQRKLQAQLMVSDRMAAAGALAAAIAHEINNPLAAVIANLDCIAEGLSGAAPRGDGAREAWLADEVKAPLEEAREAAQRVRFIVRDLKVLSRAPALESTAPVDVEAALESSLRMARHQIRHRAHVVRRYEPVPAVEANEARLGQVFLNLLLNAAQSFQEGRAAQNEIGLSTRRDGPRVVVEVSDNGPGIPPELIGRVFDALFTTKEAAAGTGLGLAICMRIVTDLGGALTVESAVGRGTTFRVALPLAREAQGPAAAPRGLAPTAVRRAQILVVDDERAVGRAVQRVLAVEHDVAVLTDAKAALAQCAGGARFDLILCDLMMPDMTGMDLHAELTRVAPEQAKRMAFMTGGAFTERARLFLAGLTDEHVEKPFDFVALRALVARRVGGGP